jgi:hypothetical protein
MILSRAILGQQLVLLLTIGLAIGLAIVYLRWRSHLDLLRALWLPATLFAIFGTLDALVTMAGTWNGPWREANPTMRAFLLWAGWWGQCVGSFLWVIGWTLVVDGLESLRQRLGGRGASIARGMQLLALYGLAAGHISGFLSWIFLARLPAVAEVFFGLYQRIPWLDAISPFSYPLYLGLSFGGLCTLLHVGILALRRRWRGRLSAGASHPAAIT